MDVNHLQQRVTMVYLVRHGQTAYNVDDRLRGHADLELTHHGYEQAEALGRIFTGVPVSRVVSSPLRRALDTARPIAYAAGVPVEVSEALNDRDYRQWTGISREDVLRRFGSLDAAPGVEPWNTLCERVAHAFDFLLRTSNGRALALVGHDATNRALLMHLIPELRHGSSRICQANGCWNRLEWAGAAWRLDVFNALPEDGQRP